MMPVDSQRKSPSGDPTVGLFKCPLCQGILLRQHRRTVDRMRSLFGSVKRYRCDNFACQWEGNFSSARAADTPANGMADSAPDQGNADSRPGNVPVAFVVHMMLVAVGVVFVFVVSSTEPTSWFGEDEPVIGSKFYEPVLERPAGWMASR